VLHDILDLIVSLGGHFRDMVSGLTLGLVKPTDWGKVEDERLRRMGLTPQPQMPGWSALPPPFARGGSPLPSSVPLPFTNFRAGALRPLRGPLQQDLGDPLGMFPRRQSMGGGGGGFGGASISEAAIAPPQDRVKPVTIATNLNIDGRLLAQQISDHLIAMMEMSSGAGASDGRSLLHLPDAGMTTT
jgi:hypothetical protein